MEIILTIAPLLFIALIFFLLPKLQVRIPNPHYQIIRVLCYLVTVVGVFAYGYGLYLRVVYPSIPNEENLASVGVSILNLLSTLTLLWPMLFILVSLLFKNGKQQQKFYYFLFAISGIVVGLVAFLL